MRKLLSVVLAAGLLASLLPTSTMALSDNAIQREYDNAVFTKISNPEAGPGEPDGINTNDSTGFEANRLNSYAWAVASRGKYIYIGTNRTLFGSALNALGEKLRETNPNLSQESLNILINSLSGGDVPSIPDEESYIPQIIRFDVENNTTKVIYQPNTVRGDDGVLYYTDKDGNLIPGSDVESETASFRSVIEFQGNLYFGSLGTNMVQLVRVDEDDNAQIVYQTLGVSSSLRACSLYGEGDEETVYFGGQDTTYGPWRAYRQNNPNSKVLPILIRYLDPETAGTGNEDWSGLVADFNDFGKYAEADVYRGSGGNVWDLCSYNGKLYVILAYDSGWVMFRGEKAPDDANANRFGWKWTEIVGDNGAYPAAMDASIGELNAKLQEDYGCSEYAAALNGAGLLESTATPYVYKGKMYIGTFDNATCIQTQTMIKLIIKMNAMLSSGQTGITGPTLSQIYAPIYEVLSHPQRIWVMDEDEKISSVDGANALLEGTTNDYVWRFAESNGKLYVGTFDSATAYTYFLNFFTDSQLESLKEIGIIPEDITASLDGSNIKRLEDRIDEILESETQLPDNAKTFLQRAKGVCEALYSVFEDGVTVDELLGDMTELKKMYETFVENNPGVIPEDTVRLIDWLMDTVDTEGLEYLAKARELIKNSETGFDIFVTKDGENWKSIVKDGLGDSYNYGARTLTVHDGELYVGTANPYYGAQLWKLTDTTPVVNTTVTFRVVNGSWDDGTTADKTVTLTGEEGDILKLAAEDIPAVGAKPDDTFKAGSWDVTPSTDTAITEETVFTYTYSSKDAAVVVKAPEANTLTYNGKAQALVTAGTAEGGEIWYALGTADGPTEPFSKEIPTGTDAGTYYVWYKVVGDATHSDTEPVCIEVKIVDPDKKDSSKTDASSKNDDSVKTDTASAANPSTGAAAGLGAMALAGAAIVVSRKKK